MGIFLGAHFGVFWCCSCYGLEWVHIVVAFEAFAESLFCGVGLMIGVWFCFVLGRLVLLLNSCFGAASWWFCGAELVLRVLGDWWVDWTQLLVLCLIILLVKLQALVRGGSWCITFRGGSCFFVCILVCCIHSKAVGSRLDFLVCAFSRGAAMAVFFGGYRLWMILAKHVIWCVWCFILGVRFLVLGAWTYCYSVLLVFVFA